MNIGDLKGIVILAGVGVLFFGGSMLNSTVNTQWNINTVGSNVTGLIAGGFLCIIGIIMVAAGLDRLDELSGIVENIWDRFLTALGR
jgi:hypothetical protein